MITGRWGKPSDVLLDIVVDADGSVRGVVNPGRQNAPIREGQFDAGSRALTLEGEFAIPGEAMVSFRIAGRLDGRTLRLTYQFGDMQGEIAAVRVEEYTPPPITLRDRLKRRLANVRRQISARRRP